MKVNTEDLVSSSEIAILLGVGNSAVSNWKVRYDDFPAPVVVLNGIPIYLIQDIGKWYMKHHPGSIAALAMKQGFLKG